MTLAQLRERYGDEDILLFAKGRVEFHRGAQPPLFFHPSMSMIRVKRMRSGEEDPLVRLAGIRPGDRIIDCTAGLGSDAIVFSYAAGEQGSVTALESAAVPCYLLKQGLAAYESNVPGLEAAMRRIEVLCCDHLSYLQALDAGSADVIYFDPMFRKPIRESSSIRAIRGLADDRALSERTIAAARRAARRAVILKEHRDSGEFARLGFEEIHRSSNKTAYGVIRC